MLAYARMSKKNLLQRTNFFFKFSFSYRGRSFHKNMQSYERQKRNLKIDDVMRRLDDTNFAGVFAFIVNRCVGLYLSLQVARTNGDFRVSKYFFLHVLFSLLFSCRIF